MEEAVLSLLLNNPVVAERTGGRIAWGERPPGDFPAITLHRISTTRDSTHQGRSGLMSSTVQADVWGSTYASAKLLARAVIPALPQGRTVVGETVLQGVFIDTESDSFEGDDPEPLYRTRIDFTVWHEEISQ